MLISKDSYKAQETAPPTSARDITWSGCNAQEIGAQIKTKQKVTPADNGQNFPIIISHLPAPDYAAKINTLQKILSGDFPGTNPPLSAHAASLHHIHPRYHRGDLAMTNAISKLLQILSK